MDPGPQHNGHAALRRLAGIAALAVLVKAGFDWWTLLRGTTAFPLWVDELVNFTWAWAKAPFWYPHQVTWLPHALALLPLRLLPDDPTGGLIAYRIVNAVVLVLLVPAALWRAGRGLPAPARLAVVAGAASLTWVWSSAAIARPNLWAVAGLAWLLVDDWRTWRSWAGFALALFFPHAALMALLFTLWRMRAPGDRRTAAIATGLVGVAALPSLVTVALSLAGRPTGGASFNRLMPEVLRSLNLVPGLPMDFPQTPVIVAVAAAVALMALFVLRQRRIADLLPAAAFIAVLAASGVTQVPPLLSRYFAPLALFAWLWLAPRVVGGDEADAGTAATLRTWALVGLAAAQAAVPLPRDAYWEAARIPAAQTTAIDAALEPCVIEVGGSMLDVLTSLDQLMTAGLWRPGQRGCEVRLAPSCHDKLLADYEPRFAGLLAPAGDSGRPARVRFHGHDRGVEACPLPPPGPDSCVIATYTALVELVDPGPLALQYCKNAQAEFGERWLPKRMRAAP